METGQERTTIVVRPFRAGIVRQECAGQNGSPMFGIGTGSGTEKARPWAWSGCG